MKIESVQFEPSGVEGWALRVSVFGQDFEQRTIPILVQVGDQMAEAIMPLAANQGVMGFLSEMPEIGAPIFVGYGDAPLPETDFTFQPPAES